ncbi:hypothetical protein JTB14_019867 [Gonioctena quinquepunctata]|nr:hypothetical protein JTB14_019867 [Gonioctena quinquepunctata]
MLNTIPGAENDWKGWKKGCKKTMAEKSSTPIKATPPINGNAVGISKLTKAEQFALLFDIMSRPLTTVEITIKAVELMEKARRRSENMQPGEEAQESGKKPQRVGRSPREWEEAQEARLRKAEWGMRSLKMQRPSEI